MKSLRKSLSFLLAFVLILTSFATCLSAFAVSTGWCEPPEDYETIAVPDDASTSVDWNALADYLYEGIYNHETSIDISSFNITKTDANLKYLQNIIYDTPKIMRQANGFTYSYYSGSNIYTKITPYYQYDADTFKQMVDDAQASVDNIVGDLKDSALSDAEKVLMVHDRLAEMVGYDYADYLAGTLPSSVYNAYGPLVNGSAVCQGYSYAMIWCLDDLGIESYYTSSTELNHGWVVAVINGERYHIDITGDDPVWDRYGECLHKNLLISTETFNTSSSNHNNNGTIATDFDQTPTDKTYEDYYWTASDTAFQFIDGNLYYINTDNGTLCKRTPAGTETVLRTISSTWKSAAYSYYGKGASFSKLTSHGTKLIYNTADTVYAYDINTGDVSTLYSVDITTNGYNCIYAMTRLGDSLKIVLSNTPNFDKDTQSGAVSLACEETKIEGKAATCTDTGLTDGAKCSVCGTILTAQEEIAAKGHTSDEGTITTAATCTTAGVKTYKCTVCGETIKTEEIAKIGHKSDEGTITTAATCTTAGVKTYKCTVCGETLKTEEIAKTGHTPVISKEAKAATCTEDGYTAEYTCSVCKAVTTASTVIKAKGHTSDSGSVTTAATCTTTGVKTYKCTVCGETLKTETIEKTGHTAAAAVKENKVVATCTTNGSYDSVVYCSVCKAELSRETITVPMTNHANSYGTKGLTPTCTQDGYTAGRYCPDCKTYISGHETLKATGHTVVTDAAVAATCSQTGLTEGSHCSVCGTVIVAQKTVAKLAHTEVTIPAVTSTCTQTGLTEGKKCSVCGTVIVAQQTVAKTAHVDNNGDGICDNCGTAIQQSNPSSNCSCNCHKSGFMGFIWKIQVFFYKIFGTNKTCSCGASHY